MSTVNAEPSTAKREESLQLESVQFRLERALQEADMRLRAYQEDIQSQKEYLWNSRDEMDHIEKISARESIQQAVTTGEFVFSQRKRLAKLRQSPYFGRFDFHQQGHDQPRPIYIGVHHFYDEVDKENVVFDWRAPIASLFYDYETGPASYTAPEGQVNGDIQLKRQFRIRHGQIELMIDSAVNVVDDVLQDELGRATDDGMKNIVATIQRDQNAIIRNEHAKTLIIQGVAGSGKTSIALHRIAFLLYRFKDTLTSEDILIISPNRVFADYISNVLPELGEETVNEIGMETLAKELLQDQYRFQTFFEQTAELLETNDEEVKRRLRYKASPDFLKQLGRYADEVEKNRFAAEDLWIARRLVPGWLVEETFRKHRNLDTTARVNQVAKEIEQKIGIQYNYDLMPEQRKELKAAIKGMVKQSTLRETYKRFFEWADQPDLFRPAKGGRLEYADVFPLIYLKMRLEGIRSPYRNVKHLLIDEMQDYTPIQYAVMARLFSCKKTILGDAFQSVNPYSASAVDDIKGAFRDATCVTLNKSYRSSYEIARFAQRISPNPDLEIIERYGEEPEVLRFKSRKQEMDAIRDRIAAFGDSRFNTLGIICKTQKQAKKLHKALEPENARLQLLSEDSQSFAPGVIVCTAHLAKGLEFDHVMLPEVTEANYHTDMDRNLLYVGCTRAMHRLTLTASGDLTQCLAPV
ncbi:3'-5' exonuclease [Marinobacter sp.]|uniref:HelD family protein n=1 Tax=Marinobacter sp. TaxID=50741 RepID=UPI0034A3FD8F